MMNIIQLAYQQHLQKLMPDTTVTVTDVSEEYVTFTIPAAIQFAPPTGIPCVFLGIYDEGICATMKIEQLEQELVSNHGLDLYFDAEKAARA